MLLALSKSAAIPGVHLPSAFLGMVAPRLSGFPSNGQLCNVQSRMCTCLLKDNSLEAKLLMDAFDNLTMPNDFTI